MKAKEYYLKFEKERKTIGDDQALFDLVAEMSGEIKTLLKARHTQSNRAVIAIIKELNDKWNAMIKWDPIFNRDGFLEFWKSRMPEIAHHF